MSFNDQLKIFFRQWKESMQSAEILMCMGSEACDIDSFVCSLVVSIHEKCTMVVNMSRKVFESKGDLMKFCSYYDISLDDLIFIEKPKGSFSLDARRFGLVFKTGKMEYYLKEKQIKLILVDHHRPIEELQGLYIDLIIDHHTLSESSLTARRVYVDIDIGSCATLVTKYIGHTLFTSKYNKRTEFESKSFCEGIAKMLMIPILVDTSNFKKTTSHFDYGEFMKLGKRAKTSKKEINKMRKEIKKARINDEHLDSEIILRKDYKRFYHKGTTFGISTVKYPFDSWADREAKEKHTGKDGLVLETMLSNFRREEGLDFFMLNRKAGPNRYLAIINCSYEKILVKDYEFKSINYKGFYYYQIPVSLSRKIMVPILKDLIERDHWNKSS